MQNDEGVKVDLYIPRKCSATNRLIEAGDHASVQINVPILDEQGVMIKGEYQPYVIGGFLRERGLSDHEFNILLQKDGYLEKVVAKSQLI